MSSAGTLRISIVGTILCLLIGFPFAYWLAVKVPPRWRGLLLGLTIVPFWTNFLVRTLGWLILLQPNGPLSGDHAGPPPDRGAAGRPRHARGRPARRRLQLPPADDLPVVRRARPPRPGAPRGVEGSRREPLEDVPTGHAAPVDARRGRGAAPGVHPAHRRLHHRGRARRGEGQHGGSPRGQPVQHGAELGARVGDGRDPHPDDPRVGRRVRGHRVGRRAPSSGALVAWSSSWSRHERDRGSPHGSSEARRDERVPGGVGRSSSSCSCSCRSR